MYELVCPRCGAALVKSQYQDRIGFVCPEGHGIAMTTSAVRAVCGNRDLINLLWCKSAAENCGNGGGCPVCRRPMRGVILNVAEKELELDICRRCQEVWFDPHELETLPPLPPKPKPLPREAREALALERIQNLQTDSSRIDSLLSHASGVCGVSNPLQYLVTMIGLPVEADDPPLRRLPIVTWALILICTVVFILTGGDLENAVKAWGFIPAEAARKGGATWITSMFMHGGILHLVGNMYFLWTFGDNVEDELGKPRYIGFVMLSGFSATLLFLALSPGTELPCVGASGFISGVIAMYAVLYPKVKILLCIRFVMFGISACLAFLLWMAFQFAMTVLFHDIGGGGVAYAAHLGGALFGLICGAAARIARTRRAEALEQIKNRPAKNPFAGRY